MEVDEGEEDEGVGGDDQHADAAVPDVFHTFGTFYVFDTFGTLETFGTPDTFGTYGTFG